MGDYYAGRLYLIPLPPSFSVLAMGLVLLVGENQYDIETQTYSFS